MVCRRRGLRAAERLDIRAGWNIRHHVGSRHSPTFRRRAHRSRWKPRCMAMQLSFSRWLWLGQDVAARCRHLVHVQLSFGGNVDADGLFGGRACGHGHEQRSRSRNAQLAWKCARTGVACRYGLQCTKRQCIWNQHNQPMARQVPASKSALRRIVLKISSPLRVTSTERYQVRKEK